MAVAQRDNLRGDQPEVFSDKRRFAEFGANRLEERVPGARAPAAIDRGVGLGRHRPIGLEAAEMIDANHVHRCQRAADAREPPTIILGRHRLPIIQRIAPFLPVLAKIIRRHARNLGRLARRVELKYLAMRPGIGAVHGDEYRDIADELYSLLARVVAQRLPLRTRDPLLEFYAPNLLGMRVARPLKRRRVAPDKFGRPIAPTLAAKLFFERYIKGVIGQPIGFGGGEGVDLAARLLGGVFVPSLKRAPKERSLLALNFPELTQPRVVA